MSLSLIKTVVENFICDKQNDLLVLKGQWGVGKTFFWQYLVQQASKTQNIGHSSYSYVSLFGISSLEELKNAILASRVDSASVKPNVSFMEWVTTAKQFLKGMEQIPAVREWTGGMAGTALFLLMKDTLICFDDIERRGAGLDAKDMLGLASLLKEQRGCKVAFIVNDGALSEDEREYFKRHSEKIIDIELQFSPLPEEVFDYVFPLSHSYYDLIKRCCLTLGVKNIRILQRINRFLDILLPYLRDSEISVRESAISSLVLYVWCYYDRDSGAPSLSYVVSYRSVDFYLAKYSGLGQKEKEESKEVKQWQELLNTYGYERTDEVDRHIKSLVEKGYLDNAAFSLDLEKKNKEARSLQGQHSYRSVWNLYHDSFKDNEREFTQELVDVTRANIMYLSLANLQSTVSTLRTFGQDAVASSLVDEYLEHHSGNPDLITIRKTMDLADIKDKYLLERLNEIWKSAKDQRTLGEVVKKLSLSNGYNPEDTELMSNCEVDEYYDFFKSEESNLLYSYVRTCLKFGEFVNADDQFREIARKAREALLKLASESRINRMRVSKLYNIKIDDNSLGIEIISK
jgi:hypothetical protein